MRLPLSQRNPARRRGPLPSPALIVAFVALLGGVVGPAWAAGLLTGADIKNGTVTGQDIKDGSVGPSDISRTGRAALEGDDGAAGQAGATGAVGAVGPGGPAGPSGPEGSTGPAGPGGAVGARGAAGERGADGADGAQGAKGATGGQGTEGPTGAQGATGATGLKGDPGADADGPWAEVTDSGGGGAPTIVGEGLAAATPIEKPVVMGEAVYAVAFDRDVSDCAALVSRRSSLGETSGQAGSGPVLLSDTDAEAGGSAYTYHDSKKPGRIRVRLLDHAGNGDQGSFTLLLRCPR